MTYKYPLLARLFHHGGAVLLLLVWMAIEFEEAVAGLGVSAIKVHKSLGVLFLVWVLARLLHAVTIPKPPAFTPLWQHRLAKMTHGGLYVAMIAMPVCGVLMSWYGGYPVSVFGLFDVPALVTPDDRLARFFEEMHIDVVFPLLVALIGLHILGVVYHQFIKKDEILRRMR